MTAWWKSVWSSPMASQYLPSDRHGLLVVAVLRQLLAEEFKLPLVAEIRLSEASYGLSPSARRSLGWSYRPATEEAEAAAPRSEPKATGFDPRKVLEMPGKRPASDVH